jgi:branched-subunit amino acid transport protein
MSLWIAVAASGLVSAALRVAFVAGNRIPVPRWFDRAASLVGPAFTAAVVGAWAFAADGAPALGPESAAVLVALPVALRTRSMLWTLTVGVAATSLLRALW